jgi:hypothetical protein
VGGEASLEVVDEEGVGVREAVVPERVQIEVFSVKVSGLSV